MPAQIDKIADEDIPDMDTDVRGWWRAIAAAAQVVNALLDFKIVTNSSRNVFTLTESNAVLELDITAAVTAAATPTDFSLYDASTTSGSTTTLKVGVKFGIVTSYLSAASVAPWPSQFSAANAYKCEFVVTGFGAAWIQMTNDTSGDLNQVSAVDCLTGSAPPAPDATYGIKALGTWTVDTTVTPNKLVILSGGGSAGIGSQQYEFIGGIHAWGPA